VISQQHRSADLSRRGTLWRESLTCSLLRLGPIIVVWLLFGCELRGSPEARVMDAMHLGIHIGDAWDATEGGLTNIAFLPEVGYTAEIIDGSSAVQSVTILARVYENPPARAPTVVGAQLTGRSGRDDLAAIVEKAATAAYGRQPLIGCAQDGNSVENVKFWRSRFGGVWVLTPRSRPGVKPWRATRVFIHGPSITQFTSPRFRPEACPA
jgi:hypothetical protein